MLPMAIRVQIQLVQKSYAAFPLPYDHNWHADYRDIFL